MCRPPYGGSAFHARGEKCGLASLLAALFAAILVLLPGNSAAPQAPPAPEPPAAAAPPLPLPVSVEVVKLDIKDADGKIIETKITGLKVKIMAIPRELVGAEGVIQLRHQDAEGVIYPRVVEFKAAIDGSIRDSFEELFAFHQTPNAGQWTVEVSFKKDAVTASGSQVVNINPELRLRQIEEQRNGYLRLLDLSKAAAQNLQKLFEDFKKQKKTGENFKIDEWQQKKQDEIQKVANAGNELRNIYVVAIFEKTRLAFNDAVMQMYALCERMADDLKGAELTTREIEASLSKEEREKRIREAGLDPNDPDVRNKIVALVDKAIKERLERANTEMKKKINQFSFELGIDIITAKHLAEDLSKIRSLTDDLFNAYKDSEAAFVPPADGKPWMENWLGDVDFLETKVSEKYSAKSDAGIQNLYSGLPKRFKDAAKALRALRDQLLLELYERHKIPAAAREKIKPGADPLSDLKAAYDALSEVVKQEREKYVPTTLAIVGEFDAMNKDLEKFTSKEVKDENLKDVVNAKIAQADNIMARAEALFDLELYPYTLPQDVSKNIRGLHNRLTFMIPLFVGANPNNKEVGNYKTLLLEAYANYSKVTRELVENALKTEKLPEKPELKKLP